MGLCQPCLRELLGFLWMQIHVPEKEKLMLQCIACRSTDSWIHPTWLWKLAETSKLGMNFPQLLLPNDEGAYPEGTHLRYYAVVRV